MDKRILHRCLSQRGFTLVEIIVTLAILSIALGVAGTILFSGNRFYTQTAVKDQEKSIGDSTFKYMKETLIYATHLEVINPQVTNPSPKYEEDFRVGTGEKANQLLIGKRDEEGNTTLSEAFGNDYYGDYTIGYNISVKDATHVELKVSVFQKSDGEQKYTCQETLEINNLDKAEGAGSSIEVTSGSYNKVYTNPIISFDTLLDFKKAVFSPNELRVFINDLAKAVGDKNYPEDYETIITGTKYVNNNQLRLYTAIFKYKGKPYPSGTQDQNSVYQYWPAFSDEAILSDLKDQGLITAMDVKIEAQVKEKDKTWNNILKYSTYLESCTDNDSRVMPYYSTTDNQCYIYVGQSRGQQWVTRLVYNHNDGTWYFYVPDLIDQYGHYVNFDLAKNYPWERKSGANYDGLKQHLMNSVNIANFPEDTVTGTWIKVSK